MNLLYDVMQKALPGLNIKAHDFSDVERICRKKYINLTICNYDPDILGYFCTRKCNKITKRFIVINSLLDELNRTYIGLHELGHFFLHVPVSSRQWFYCRRTAQRTEDKHDAEANAFALIAMIPLWLMIDLHASSAFMDAQPEMIPLLHRRFQLWEQYGI